MANAPYAVAIEEAIKYQRELLQTQREVAQWLWDQIGDKDKVTTYDAFLGNIPVGSIINFACGNVDDEATLRFEGYGQVIRLNDPPLKESREVNGKGQNMIAFSVTNSGGFNWGFYLKARVNSNPNLIIDWKDGGNDNGYFYRKRIYMFRFNGV